jgi:hypothetical protein
LAAAYAVRIADRANKIALAAATIGIKANTDGD